MTNGHGSWLVVHDASTLKSIPVSAENYKKTAEISKLAYYAYLVYDRGVKAARSPRLRSVMQRVRAPNCSKAQAYVCGFSHFF